jgi:drug/metabolite transporter (DMT)-like permease
VIGCAVLAGDRVSLASGIDGDGLALVTALFYGSYFLVLSRVRARVGTMLAMAVTAGSCSMFLLPAALVSGESMVPQSLHAWAILLGLALVSQVAGQTLIGWALKHLPASYSSVSLLLQPVVAASLAWLLLGERLGIFQVVGGMIILASIVAARRASR